LLCQTGSVANQGVLEASLSPSNGATVTAGSPVVFSGQSGATPTFAVASSPALLASPDIDSGLGSASSGHSYTFSSTNATTTPRTIYWDASFSDAGLAECAGLAPTTYTTSVRTLTVLPGPEPTPTPGPAPVTTPSPVSVSIDPPAGFHLAHPIVRYQISCTASCAGSSSYQVFVLRHHAKAARASKLDLSSERVSITAAGGNELVSHRYSGHALRMLASILREGGVIELRIDVTVTGASGNVARARRTARLRA